MSMTSGFRTWKAYLAGWWKSKNFANVVLYIVHNHRDQVIAQKSRISVNRSICTFLYVKDRCHSWLPRYLPTFDIKALHLSFLLRDVMILIKNILLIQVESTIFDFFVDLIFGSWFRRQENWSLYLKSSR